MAKISIVVPVYNVEKYLKKCIESIINQSLQDIEIICVNDGSTDSSLEILNDFASKDKRVVVINKTNSGYGHTMNMGLNTATGEYIGIIESDDFADLRMFEELYKLAKDNDADIVKGDWYNYWSKNDFARKKQQNLFCQSFQTNKFTKRQKPIAYKSFCLECNIQTRILK